FDHFDRNFARRELPEKLAYRGIVRSERLPELGQRECEFLDFELRIDGSPAQRSLLQFRLARVRVLGKPLLVRLWEFFGHPNQTQRVPEQSGLKSEPELEIHIGCPQLAELAVDGGDLLPRAAVLLLPLRIGLDPLLKLALLGLLLSEERL